MGLFRNDGQAYYCSFYCIIVHLGFYLWIGVLSCARVVLLDRMGCIFK